MENFTEQNVESLIEGYKALHKRMEALEQQKEQLEAHIRCLEERIDHYRTWTIRDDVQHFIYGLRQNQENLRARIKSLEEMNNRV